MIHSAAVSLLALLSLPNSPYPQGTTLIPALSLELNTPVKNSYVLIENSARCLPDEWNRWNPITALWKVELGFTIRDLRIGIGHQSEHGVDEIWRATESRDYLFLRLKLR